MATILFVDDDPLTLALLAKTAEMYGHRPLLALSGGEALESAVELCPDIIFVDHLLADMDGLAVIRSLCANAATGSIPIILLSAGQELDIEHTALSAGAVAFLHKPVQLHVFQEIVDHYALRKT
jgi:two-component system, cell cycle response regulator DivK